MTSCPVWLHSPSVCIPTELFVLPSSGEHRNIEPAGTLYKVIDLYVMGSLLKTLPLHQSQQVIRETESEIILSCKLVVNLELKQRLLMMATQARVIHPLSLKKEIEIMITEAQRFYTQ